MTLEDAKHEVDRAFTAEDFRGLAFENVFSGAPSFLRRRYAKDVRGADLAVTGIAFDQAVTNRPGARFGPRAIREASLLQPCDPPYGWGFSPLEDFAIADAGDMAFDYADVAAVPGLIEAHVAGLLGQDAGVIALGGDHSITLPILRAHAARHGPLSVIQFDAHSDLWEPGAGHRVDHGTFMHRAVTEGLVRAERSVQIGIRTVCEDVLGVGQLDARTCHERGPDWVASTVKQIVRDGPVYLSFDIDCLDPAHAPGTGTPVWGGLASWQVAAILRDLAGVHLVGGDVVEVSPPYDHGDVTALAGAHVATELCCLYLWNRRRDAAF